MDISQQVREGRCALLKSYSRRIVSWCVISCVLLSGCAKTPVEDTSPVASAPQWMSSEDFLARGWEIEATLTDTATDPARTALVALTVDAGGGGVGTLSVGELYCDIIVSQDRLYLVFDSSTVVQVEDVTGHMVTIDSWLQGEQDLTLKGFSLDNGVPASYQGKQGSLLISTYFKPSTETVNPTSLMGSRSLSFSRALDYLIDYNNNNTSIAEGSGNTVSGTTEVKDFYNNSMYGVTIEGTTYSLGDTCNPSTYFRESVPEGLVYSNEYKEDSKIAFVHVSYLSSDGRTVFTTTSNYVQAIQTSADFEFLGLKRGDDFKALDKILGFSVPKKEEDMWHPIDPDIILGTKKSKLYTFTVGGYYVELRSDDNKTLSEIYIEQPLDFKGVVRK